MFKKKPKIDKLISTSNVVVDLLDKSDFFSNETLKPTELLKMDIKGREKIIQSQLLVCSNVYDFIEDEQEYIEYE